MTKVPLLAAAIVAALLVFGAGGFASGQSPAAAVRVELRLYELLQLGRFRDARALVESSRARAATAADRERAVSMRVRLMLEEQAWGEARRMSQEAEGPLPHAMWYGMGLAAARSGGPDGNPSALPLAQAAAARLEIEAVRAGRRSLIELERLSVRAAIAAAQEERGELALLLSHLIDLDADAPPQHPPQPVIPLRELAGDLWLAVDRERDAIREYTAALSRHPNRARSLIGLARAAARTSDAVLARDAYRLFLAEWAHADPERAELREAVAYLGFVKP